MSKDGRQVEREVELELGAGQYTIAYQPTRAYFETFSTETPITKLVRSEKAVQSAFGDVPDDHDAG